MDMDVYWSHSKNSDKKMTSIKDTVKLKLRDISSSFEFYENIKLQVESNSAVKEYYSNEAMEMRRSKEEPPLLLRQFRVGINEDYRKKQEAESNIQFEKNRCIKELSIFTYEEVKYITTKMLDILLYKIKTNELSSQHDISVYSEIDGDIYELFYNENFYLQNKTGEMIYFINGWITDNEPPSSTLPKQVLLNISALNTLF